jgi:hypothetical protein
VFRISGCRDTRRCRIFSRVTAAPHPRCQTTTATTPSSSKMEKPLHRPDRAPDPTNPLQKGLKRRPQVRRLGPLRSSRLRHRRQPPLTLAQPSNPHPNSKCEVIIAALQKQVESLTAQVAALTARRAPAPAPTPARQDAPPPPPKAQQPAPQPTKARPTKYTPTITDGFTPVSHKKQRKSLLPPRQPIAERKLIFQLSPPPTVDASIDCQGLGYGNKRSRTIYRIAVIGMYPLAVSATGADWDVGEDMDEGEWRFGLFE